MARLFCNKSEATFQSRHPPAFSPLPALERIVSTDAREGRDFACRRAFFFRRARRARHHLFTPKHPGGMAHIWAPGVDGPRALLAPWSPMDRAPAYQFGDSRGLLFA